MFKRTLVAVAFTLATTSAAVPVFAAQSGGVAAQAAAENVLTGALRQLFALSEAYPDLTASQNFQQLQAQLSDIENTIAAARRFCNNAVPPCCWRARSDLRRRISSTSAPRSARCSSRRRR